MVARRSEGELHCRRGHGEARAACPCVARTHSPPPPPILPTFPSWGVPKALSWGLICGFDSFIPYFYLAFFLAMISHRAYRDNQRCAAKYKKDWDAYCSQVPYTFIPGLI